MGLAAVAITSVDALRGAGQIVGRWFGSALALFDRGVLVGPVQSRPPLVGHRTVPHAGV
jgi:hypothetical protein